MSNPIKPPIGVIPLSIWIEENPEPSVAAWLARYGEVRAAIDRYRDAGLPVNELWLVEILGPTLWYLKGLKDGKRHVKP